MQLPDRTGIACDLCGLQVRDQFTYYSFDFRPAHFSDGPAPPVRQIMVQPVIKSLDVCTKCFEELKLSIKYRAVPRGVVCDKTGVHMTGTFICHHVNVIRVKVNVKARETVTDDRHVEFYFHPDVLTQLAALNKGKSEWSSSSG